MDTSAYSHMRMGHPELSDLLASAEALLLPVIVPGELEGAFELRTATSRYDCCGGTGDPASTRGIKLRYSAVSTLAIHTSDSVLRSE
jgi:hypothetical protein